MLAITIFFDKRQILSCLSQPGKAQFPPCRSAAPRSKRLVQTLEPVRALFPRNDTTFHEFLVRQILVRACSLDPETLAKQSAQFFETGCLLNPKTYPAALRRCDHPPTRANFSGISCPRNYESRLFRSHMNTHTDEADFLDVFAVPFHAALSFARLASFSLPSVFGKHKASGAVCDLLYDITEKTFPHI